MVPVSIYVEYTLSEFESESEMACGEINQFEGKFLYPFCQIMYQI